MFKKPGRPITNKPKEGRPYRRRVSTYVQGTLLKLLEYHLSEELVSPYLRGLIKRDLTERYDIHPDKGVVKIPRLKAH